MEIVGLALGVLGAIGGFLWIRDYAKRWITARAFWRIFDFHPGQRVIVVVPTGGKCSDRDGPDSMPVPGPNIVTTIEDSMARSAIYGVMIAHGITPEVRLHSDLADKERAEHLVLICGPAGNCITRDLLERTDLIHHYTFSRTGGHWSILDVDHSVVHSYTDGATIDYAIIAKYKNPWALAAERRNVYVLAGLEGLGTWGAAHFIATRTNILLRYLKAPGSVNSNSCFSAVATVRRDGGECPRVDEVRVHSS